MKNKWLKGIFTAFLSAFLTLGGCSGAPGDSDTGGESGTSGGGTNFVEENSLVKSVTAMGSVTGSKSPWNDTLTGAGVAGTDLGIPVYDTKNQRMLLFYGDTFSGQNKGEGSGYNDWRSNVCAYSADLDLSDGLTLDGWITREGREQAKQLIPSVKTDNYEITTIPTGAVEIGGDIYVFYMSVRHWGANGEWTVNYCGLVKSTDGGENYSRVDGVYFTGIKDTITAELTGAAAADVKAHYAPGLCQVYPLVVGEYVYCYGIEGGRFGGVQLARVKKADFENFDEYEYYTGRDETGNPLFVKGAEGRKILVGTENKSSYILDAPAGEMCVMYNRYLGKYMTIYQRSTVMILRTSETPWGEWSEAVELVGYDDFNAMYCGFMHEKYTEQDGKIVYFMMSYWWDYESILMKMELY